MYRALIVDDEDIIKIGLKTIIDWEQLGFEIVGTAEDGLEAIKKVEELSPDLIITDIIMPRMDGIELMEELKKRGFAGKIIVLSNYGEVDYVKRAMKLGAEDYILKVSYSKEEFAVLLKKMAALLGESGKGKFTSGIDACFWPSVSHRTPGAYTEIYGHGVRKVCPKDQNRS